MARRWWCAMCDRLFSKGGDCPQCGFQLAKWPSSQGPGATSDKDFAVDPVVAERGDRSDARED